MAKTFEFAIPEGADAAGFLDRARAQGRSLGVAFEGDAQGGRFSGAAEGVWSVEAGRLRVVVERKPFLLPWSLLESALARALAPEAP